MGKFAVPWVLICMTTVALVCCEPEPSEPKLETDTVTGGFTTILTQVIFRHGDRNVLHTFPNDPYADEQKYWPEGFGQLTNIGKVQAYKLGLFLRKRYTDLISDEYKPSELYVLSSDCDRTIMSAQCLLSGLYPPIRKQKWHDNLEWQPIPVHTIPMDSDTIFYNIHKCPRLDMLIKQVKGMRVFQEFEEKYPNLFQYVSENLGDNVTTIEEAGILYSTFAIQELHGYTVPAWAKKVFPEPLRQVRALELAMQAYNREIQRLRSGPLVADLLMHIKGKLTGNLTQNMFLYSTHNKDISAFMRSIGYLYPLLPAYTDCILIDVMRSEMGDHIVRFLYRDAINGTMSPISVKGCDIMCPLTQFADVMKSRIPTNWQSECVLDKSFHYKPNNTVKSWRDKIQDQ